MPEQTIVLNASDLYRVANVVIGFSYIVIAVAFCTYLIKRKERHHPWAFHIICAFALLAGISRLAKGIDVAPAFVVGLDSLAALAGVLAALVVWPMLIGLLKLPSRDSMEELNTKLMHSQQLFEGFMKHSPSLHSLKDQQLRFLYVNDAFCETFGVKRHDILGKTNQAWMPPQVATELHQSDMEVMQTMQPTESVVTIPTAQGKRTMLMVKFPIWDSQFMIGAIAIDISRELEAREAQKRAEQTFQQMISAVKEYAIFLLDKEGNIQTWSEGASRLKGYTAEEIIGKHFSLFYTPEDRETNHPQEELELAKKNGQYEEEGWRVRKDGSRFWAHVTITAVFDDGQLIGFAKVSRDMTKQRQAQQELALAHEKALEASALKSAFVANISHEIRTPLSGILGMNELLLQSNLDEEQKELARTVQASSESLLTVLNDVLDLSKVEAGKLTLEANPFNVSFTTQDATRLMAATAKNKGLDLSHQIDLAIPELVIGDAERLRQILLNLIGNAVKFTQKGSVSVQAKVLEEDQDTVTISFVVNDTGIGIAEEDRANLFAPFSQADSSNTRKYGGTGLGLTICKHLVELMGGQIGLESEKDKGSTFWFKVAFPKTVAGAVEFSQRATGVSSPTEPTVLLVEDNVILQDLAQKQLANLGIKSVIATCGSEAIEAINGTQFDAIFMDCHLPKMDGYEATQVIRKIEKSRNRRTPIIAMTANAMTGDKERALAAGMDDYIAKPVKLQDLKSACEKWIPRQQSKQTS